MEKGTGLDMEKRPYLYMENITKEFPGVCALDHIQFSCKQGEIHALVGENGAGKSTLMNILGGLLIPEEGEIWIAGKKVKIPNPRESERLGIGFVHQECNLLPNLMVYENIFLGRELTNQLGNLDKETMQSKIWEVNEKLGYQLNPNLLVSDLKLAEQQLCEIARAVMPDPEILIMDEPTAALSEEEAERLFKIIDRLRKDGVCIIYISHRLEEIVKIADRVTIFKDGTYVGELRQEEITKDKMISMMVGRTLMDIYPDRKKRIPSEILLEIDSLKVGDIVKKVSFQVRAGEILGLGGLEGQGQRETVRAVFGDIPFEKGSVKVGNQFLKSKGIDQRIQAKLGYVTHDRRGEGLVLGLSLRKNMVLASLKKLCTGGMIKKEKEIKMVGEQMESLQIKASSMESSVATLSGGNQQKVMLARWLMVEPHVLIVDEPTKGVDVGARMSVYKVLDDLTMEGIAILLLTSDMLELMGLSDRILVFYEGEIVEEIEKKDATEERLMRAASGIKKKEVNQIG